VNVAGLSTTRNIRSSGRPSLTGDGRLAARRVLPRGGRGAVSIAARSASSSPSASASRRIVAGYGFRRAPRSRSAMQCRLRAARSASSSWLSPAAARYRCSNVARGSPLSAVDISRIPRSVRASRVRGKSDCAQSVHRLRIELGARASGCLRDR
jgi:hypothetical protein